MYFACNFSCFILKRSCLHLLRHDMFSHANSWIVDAENAVCHLLPFIAGENHCVRQRILDTVTSCS
ncbi:hypothetical protein GBAR_LOCUS24701 [Geodia barretti]|uniref:Uncharacterized protein n=1 Tax=Geodia barretti TaxID=519541 RepID=A0AA35TAS8_GEOBA|nr:hypothetical protein GBAR_LOCUS24701 [Geodia barretti]